jgi:Tol biopolymer transport system component
MEVAFSVFNIARVRPIRLTHGVELIRSGPGPCAMTASTIMIYDVNSGTSHPVLTTDRLVEAPNWAPDGKSLMVNGEGRLYRLALDGGGDLVEIDTGFARTCNNDHGISPDGSQLVISDSTQTGQSCIYTLPASGGPPRRVTDNVPSYWHGWSPDGHTLAYCAKRDGVFDIYSIDAEGGAERRLTDGAGHNDGPDYSPDGQWIWFNSSRSGIMQIWRMRADGSGLQQMTDDRYSNWFPHPSPDGRLVLFLAYGPGVDGHPRDHDVELKQMAPDGSGVRTIVALFGGQGSINVPCWSPDASRFAFVQYERNGAS